MESTSAGEAMRELTMLLMYLSRFSEHDRFSEAEEYNAWKGYDFDIINQLAGEDYIRQGSRPSRSKSVYITDSGMELAKKLMEKYQIKDWE